jgi:K(+)-stimulated pyrophosphate-energized sodium pump
MLAMEIAITDAFAKAAPYVGGVFFVVALVFVWRSFFTLRIKKDPEASTDKEKDGAA